MRILYFTRDYTPHDHRFLSALAKTGESITALRLERRGFQREDRPLPVEVEQVLWRGGQKPARLSDGPALWWDLKRVIRAVRPDVIHAGPIQSASFLTALAGFRPLVSMSWGSDLLRDADSSAGMRFATQFTLNRTAALVGDCAAVREKAASFGFPRERTVLFPWGVDLKQFSRGDGANRLRARLGWEKQFVLLCSRAWEPIYGVDVAARAFVLAARENPELRLILLGNGSQAGKIRQILAEAQEMVYFGGQVSQTELPEVYRAADLYVSASHSDGSSVSLLEAMACGLPALVSDIPGNCEWVREGQNGWLFADGAVEELAKCMLAASRGSHAERGNQELKEMGAAARRTAEERADWERNFPRLLEAYEMARR
ncbi:MAG TPA: glycosyltransferase family 4 protein [Anaerolineaceae bacterium]|nr:glycosyltransferase family 4 protein [Anaerolineaceae bacterium]